MKYTKTMQALAAALLLLFAVSALAADKGNKTTVTVLDPVMVNGKTLTPGDYTVTWEGSGSDVQVSFLRGKKVVATASAKIETRGVAYSNTAYVTRKDGSGLALVEIRPEGRNQALALSGSETASGQQ
ncbi:MAG TPA: hypothetical protein VE825_01990 [Terriglobales bacterium]|nr:hypothetical protein [Terriglobales bacterium]